MLEEKNFLKLIKHLEEELDLLKIKIDAEKDAGFRFAILAIKGENTRINKAKALDKELNLRGLSGEYKEAHNILCLLRETENA